MSTFIQYFNSQFTWLQWGDFALRVLVACVCGAFIGFERSRRFKEAGIRTHIIVCCAAALIMIVSKYGFVDMTGPDNSLFNGTRGSDPARIAAQVVSGISFLCAGVIFKNGSTIKGLTTAAGIWATAAIGLAVGAGMYVMGIFVTAIVAILQYVMHRFTVGGDSYATNVLVFTVRDDADLYALLDSRLKAWGGQVVESSVTRTGEGLLEYTLTLRALQSITGEEIDRFVRENPSVLSGSNQPVR